MLIIFNKIVNIFFFVLYNENIVNLDNMKNIKYLWKLRLYFMNSYYYLFEIALILFSTKLLGLLFRRIRLPQVVGALLAGIIIGPCMLGLVSES